MSKKWYHKWFNSPFYHVLYNRRNQVEAEFFIDNLCNFLNPAPESKLLDIACGRGRHSIYLNKKGYDVIGIDLSAANIEYAKQFENEKLHFYKHDMRKLLHINYFDLGLNLFTSFGYFESEKEHVKALKVFNRTLKKDGLLVLDFFNTEKIIKSLHTHETKTVEGIDFNIHKQLVAGKIIKSISFNYKNKHYEFAEEVKALTRPDFERMFIASNFTVLNTFGNYKLEEFDEQSSDRLIFVCRKNDA